MSQFWHAHWAEESFKPTRLQNWEVPMWHPEWPVRHCTTTKFIAHKNGRLYADCKRSKNPWSNFKGTWELPLKIDRQMAEKLSKVTEYKKKSMWNVYEKQNNSICKGITISKNKKNLKDDTHIEKKIDKSESLHDTEEKNLNHIDDVFKHKCKISETCKL